MDTYRFQGKRILLFGLVAFLCILVGCREEEDTSIPEIYITKPSFRQQFGVLDTIMVAATVSDKKPIQSVRVSLTNADFITVSTGQTFFPGNHSFEVNTQLVIEDELLESGTYYVLVRAVNEANFKNKYQEIQVSGLDRDFVQALVITGGSNEVGVYGTADFDQANALLNVTGDFAGAAVSNKHKLLFLAGQTSPNILAVDLEALEPAWEKTLTPGIPIHNPGCLFFDEHLFATYNYEFIHGYDPAGNIGFNVFIDEFDAPAEIHRQGNFVLTEVQRKNAHNPFLATYFATTGNEKQRRFIDFNVIEFHRLSDQHAIVVANRAQKGLVLIYDLGNDILTEVVGSDGVFRSSAYLGNGMIAIGTEQRVLLCNTLTEQLGYLLEKPAHVVRYEYLSKSLLIADGEELRLYAYPEMVNQKTLLFSDTILDMLIQYSK